MSWEHASQHKCVQFNLAACGLRLACVALLAPGPPSEVRAPVADVAVAVDVVLALHVLVLQVLVLLMLGSCCC